jgi:hypothetical protein
LIGVSDALGMKWMRGLMTQDRALDLMGEAIDIELGPQP